MLGEVLQEGVHVEDVPGNTMSPTLSFCGLSCFRINWMPYREQSKLGGAGNARNPATCVVGCRLHGVRGVEHKHDVHPFWRAARPGRRRRHRDGPGVDAEDPEEIGGNGSRSVSARLHC